MSNKIQIDVEHLAYVLRIWGEKYDNLGFSDDIFELGRKLLEETLIQCGYDPLFVELIATLTKRTSFASEECADIAMWICKVFDIKLSKKDPLQVPKQFYKKVDKAYL